tara:strand:+ start:5418 stop:5564 length:147 start_codon:yes stop_codon:yes gene_type:complete
MRNDIIGRRQLRWPGYPLQLENFFAKSLDLESYPCIFQVSRDTYRESN